MYTQHLNKTGIRLSGYAGRSEPNRFSHGVGQIVNICFAGLMGHFHSYCIVALYYRLSSHLNSTIRRGSGINTPGMVFLTESPPHLLEEGFLYRLIVTLTDYRTFMVVNLPVKKTPPIVKMAANLTKRSYPGVKIPPLLR